MRLCVVCGREYASPFLQTKTCGAECRKRRNADRVAAASNGCDRETVQFLTCVEEVVMRGYDHGEPLAANARRLGLAPVALRQAVQRLRAANLLAVPAPGPAPSPKRIEPDDDRPRVYRSPRS